MEKKLLLGLGIFIGTVAGLGKGGEMESGYNGAYDALRGWAAFGVVAVHCHLLVPFGWVGLLLFYVLSGYLVGRSWLSVSRRAGGLGEAARGYFLRRVLRIFPLYYFYLGVLVLLASGGLILPYIWGVFPSLFLGYFAWVGLWETPVLSLWYSHLWSISVELQYYVLIPVFFLLVRPVWRVRVLWALVVLTPLLRVGVYFLLRARGEEAVERVLYTLPVQYLDAFALGLLLVVAPFRGVGVARAWLLGYGMFLLVGGVIFWWVVSPPGIWFWSLGYTDGTGSYYFSGYGQWWWGFSLLHLFFYFLIGWVSAGGRLGWVIDNRVTRYLGEISYGIYVYHFAPALILLQLLGYEFGKGFPPLWTLVVIYGGAVGVASLSYKYVELPFLRRRK